MGDFDLGLMTFQEQLEFYAALKEMVTKNVRNPPKLLDPGRTWVVYGQKHTGDKWGRKRFPTYVEAFRFMKPRLKTYHDISITSTRLQFKPPGRVVKIKRNGRPLMVVINGKKQQETRFVAISPPPGHLWCKYCRRFSVFVWYTSHHAFPKDMPITDPSIRRCAICGVTERWGAWRH